MIALFCVVSLLAVYLATLATVAIQRDRELRVGPRIAQLLLAWLLPVLGPALVLFVVSEHSPDIISRLPAAWPLKRIIQGRRIVENRYRDDRLPIGDIEGD